MVDDTKKLKSDWYTRIKAEQKKHKEFRERAKKAVEVYENDHKGENGAAKEIFFPVMRSVVDVQLGALTSKQPQARLSKRFEMEGQDGLCDKLELAANYFIEKGNMQGEIYQAAEDYLTAGVGGLKLVYDAELIEQPIIEQAVDEMGNPYEYDTGEVEEVIKSESLVAERFEWCNFGWQPAARWKDVDWIYFESDFTVKEFQKKYDVAPSMLEPNKDPGDDYKNTVTVYEIWDKENERRITICDSHDEVLEDDENPLNTEHFYPIAEPMFFALADDELTPCPEFFFWSTMHDRIQKLSEREGKLIARYKDMNFYDQGAFTDLVTIESAVDGANVPVDLKKYMTGTGLPDISKVVMAKDNSQTATVLAMVKENIQEGLSRIYQVTGIGDIMQAASDPNETATAQNLKHSWGSSRLSAKRFCIENHIRGTIEVMVNTMCKLFEPQSIALAAGEQLSEQEIQILQNSDEYRIDVETLSTLSIDKDRDQQNAVEMVNALSSVFNPQLAIPQPIQLSLINSLVETFPGGRELQQTMDGMQQHFDTVGQLNQQMQQMQQQLQQTMAQNEAMANELNKYTQAELMKDQAEAEKKAAEVTETQAKTEKIQIESAQKAAEMYVPPNAMMDERIAMQPTYPNQ
jgi:hypothetical protein